MDVQNKKDEKDEKDAKDEKDEKDEKDAQNKQPDTRNIRRVWSNKTSRKIFLDIISGTQLRKCKQVKRLLVRLMNEMMADDRLTDELIYARCFKFIHQDLSPDMRSKIQHKENYRNVNRANKICQLVARHLGRPPQSILDIGCDDGAITSLVGSMLKLPPSAIHGCDIIAAPPSTQSFVYHMTSAEQVQTGELSCQNAVHDVVYALMSLHHIHNAMGTLAEIHRVLKPGGLFIIREHDCTNEDYAAVLDVIHGFYSMVWSNPKEKCCFKDEFWSRYWTASALHGHISNCGFERLLTTHDASANVFPTYYKGRIVNPLKYYYSVYRKACV